MLADAHDHVHTLVHARTRAHAHTQSHTPHAYIYTHAHTYQAFTNDFVIVQVSVCVGEGGWHQTSTHTMYMYTGQLSQPISYADWKVNALHVQCT